MNLRSLHGAIASLCFALLAHQVCAADDPLVIRSVQNGAWSAPATWDMGRVPKAGDRVLIRAGDEVEYDVVSDQAIRVLKIAGTLRFATDRDTRLDVGLIRVEAGDEVSDEGFDCAGHLPRRIEGASRPALEVGTEEHPVAPQHAALIR